MARTTSGDRLLLFFRDYEKRNTDDGAKLRFQTEHTLSKEKEKISTWTKDGLQNKMKDGETAIDIKSIKYEEDGDILNVFDQLEELFDNNKLVEVWEVNLDKYEAKKENPIRYFQGYLESFEYSAADEAVDATMKYVANGKGVKGTDELTEAQLAAIEAEAYEYTSIKALGEA